MTLETPSLLFKRVKSRVISMNYFSFYFDMIFLVLFLMLFWRFPHVILKSYFGFFLCHFDVLIWNYSCCLFSFLYFRVCYIEVLFPESFRRDISTWLIVCSWVCRTKLHSRRCSWRSRIVISIPLKMWFIIVIRDLKRTNKSMLLWNFSLMEWARSGSTFCWAEC